MSDIRKEANSIKHINIDGYILSVGQELTASSNYKIGQEVKGTITGLWTLDEALVIEMNKKYFGHTTGIQDRNRVVAIADGILDLIDADLNLSYEETLMTYLSPGFNFRCNKTFKLPNEKGWNVKYWKCRETVQIKMVEYLEDTLELTLKAVNCGHETYKVRIKQDASDIKEVLQYLHLEPIL